jgi:hypothetical protein
MPIQKLEESKTRHIEIWGHHIDTPLLFLFRIMQAMRAGYSPIIIICGRQRSGKSFIALWLALIIYKLNGKDLKLENIIFYDPDEAIRKLEFKDKDVEWIDEPDPIDYQEWQQKTHRAIRSMVNTQGYKNNLYIIVTPFKGQIDKSIRVHADFTIRTVARGHFKAFQEIKKYDANDLKDATHSEFMDDVSIRKNAIPKEIWAEYEIYSKKAKEKIRIQRLNREPAKEKTHDEQLNDLIVMCEKRTD